MLSGISSDPSVSGLNPKAVKQTVMPFAKYKLEEATKGGPRVGFRGMNTLQYLHMLCQAVQ